MKERIDILDLYKKIFDILPGGSLQKLMETCYEVIGLPIQVTDIMYNLYGVAPKEKCGDYYWDFLLEHHGYTDEMIMQLYDEGIMQTADENDTPYIVDFGEAARAHPKYLGLIKVNNITEGYVSMLCKNEDLTPEVVEAMKIIINACSLLFKEISISHDPDMTHKKVFTDALFNNQIQSQKQLELWDKKIGVNLGANFRILAVRLVNVHEKTTLSYLRKSMVQLYLYQLTVVQDNTLYILLYNLDRKSDELPKNKQFRSLVTRFNAYCGVSNTFDNLLEFASYQKQAYDALALGKDSNPKNRIHMYKDYYLQAIFSLRVSQMPINNYVSPIITKIEQYDLEHSTDYLNTLKEYINNLCNVTLAANALHLHRNSLLYRINKIEEITNSSLKDYKTFLHLIVSFYMLEKEE